LLGLAVAAITAGLGTAKPASAASTITVDCAADSSALASALMSAADGDTLAIQGTCKGTFEIAHSLTLAGSAGATLDGQGAGTVVTVDAGNTVAISNLTITGGNGISAGGILNKGALTLTNSTMSGNSATPARSPLNFGGGGIFNLGGTLTLTNSTVSGNSASVGFGINGVGGILSLGSLTLTRSTVSGNSATSGVSSSTAVGGLGVCCGFGSSVTLTSSTVSGNSGSALSDAFGGILSSGSVVTVATSLPGVQTTDVQVELPGGSSFTVVSSAGAATTFVYTPTGGHGLYKFQVRTNNGGNTSDWSPTARVTF